MRIERVTVDGRSGLAMFVDSKFVPVEESKAAFLKVNFDDGGQLILANEPTPQKNWRTRAWNESEHPREPAGSPQGGQFAGGGGGAGPSKKESKLDDFAKDNIRVDPETQASDEKGKKFLELWNEHIGQAPAEFKNNFLGGLSGTMGLKYNEHSDYMEITGRLLSDAGKEIGQYDRTIYFDGNKASSDFFKLIGRETGHNIGKQMLAANVKLYQQIGLDKVEVHANIDVGGYAWAKYGYVPTGASWRELSGELEDRINQMSGGSTGYTPESWDELGESQQTDVRDKWKDYVRDEFYDSEVESWRDSGGDLAEAKTQLADTFPYDQKRTEWAWKGLLGYAIVTGEGEAVAGESLGPYLIAKGSSVEAVLANTTVEFDNRRGDGEEDPTVTIDDTKTPELTDDDRKQIDEMLVEVFNKEADKRRGDLEPPEWINDNLDDSMNEIWDSMRDRDKFKWASEHDALPTETEATGSGEIDADEAETLRELAYSGDPKAIWAIADSEHGKELLLGTHWNGVLDLHDDETMERFHAYVGKK